MSLAFFGFSCNGFMLSLKWDYYVKSRLVKKEAKQELKADFFQAGDFVDVSGTSIGKGFQGGMKRWHWSGGPAGHGSAAFRNT